MDEDFRYFVKDKGFGPPTHAQPVPVTSSGVLVEGYLQPRTTVYPLYQGR